MVTIIRVGEKNNFNQTEKEFQELRKYEKKGLLFTNSNSFNAIDSRLPSFITINPYLIFYFRSLTRSCSALKLSL